MKFLATPLQESPPPPKSRGRGTKHRMSSPLQKVWSKCSLSTQTSTPMRPVLNSTQQEITDAGSQHIEVRISIIIYTI